ncbi:hypothetical protein [Mycobacterium sp.]|uniref:hypothetical protein n=1 Tax=Mycobacterium sp. TaxID=1785 RepID=UPI002C326C0B|nr:hypothetical protein [Mycobacterium sp.]HKP44377.1 hypothetical protein [Mycobacterium sp.]
MTTIKRLFAVLALLGMLGGFGAAAVVIFGNYSKPQPTATPRTTLAPPPPSVPTVKEFTVGVVVTETNCPPGGGCVYKYTIEPKYIGFHPLPVTEFTVEYQVTGGNQPQPGKFTVKGDQAQILKDVVLDGPPGAKLQAVVTRVIG